MPECVILEHTEKNNAYSDSLTSDINSNILFDVCRLRSERCLMSFELIYKRERSFISALRQGQLECPRRCHSVGDDVLASRRSVLRMALRVSHARSIGERSFDFIFHMV